jgi:hypothetical protein
MATDHEAFAIGPVRAQPGASASGMLDVAARAGDAGTHVPITILHGPAPGPVLALVAGVHGMEYVPVLALQRAAAAIDPAALRGTTVLVHAANLPSLLGRTIYYSPVDGKNLNRVFPGRPDGTISERIAHVITAAVVSRATHLVDLHGGDGNESLRPYSYWITNGPPTWPPRAAISRSPSGSIASSSIAGGRRIRSRRCTSRTPRSPAACPRSPRRSAVSRALMSRNWNWPRVASLAC